MNSEASLGMRINKNFQPLYRKAQRFLRLGASVHDEESKRLPSKEQVFTRTAFILGKLSVKLNPEVSSQIYIISRF